MGNEDNAPRQVSGTRGLVSLILPYWDRQEAADEAIDYLCSEYGGAARKRLPLEVIIVDDGSPVPFSVASPLRRKLNIKVLRLPVKSGPKTPGVPLNRGVEASTGEFIALSGIEMKHCRGPILAKLRAEVRRHEPNVYVSAACWCPDGPGRWHCHGSRNLGEVSGVKMPAVAQYNFMAMMDREAWDRSGGFDERYRDGAGYEDADFVKRLERAGTKFVMRDDLVVEHSRKGAQSAWTGEMFERNRRLFAMTWRGRV